MRSIMFVIALLALIVSPMQPAYARGANMCTIAQLAASVMPGSVMGSTQNVTAFTADVTVVNNAISSAGHPGSIADLTQLEEVMIQGGFTKTAGGPAEGWIQFKKDVDYTPESCPDWPPNDQPPTSGSLGSEARFKPDDQLAGLGWKGGMIWLFAMLFIGICTLQHAKHQPT